MNKRTGPILTAWILLIGGLIVAWPGANTAAAKSDPQAGKAIFSSKCAACHGGGKFLKAKAAAKDWTAIIKQGGAKLKRSPAMPGFGSSLSDKDIDNVIAYMRTIAKK